MLPQQRLALFIRQHLGGFRDGTDERHPLIGTELLDLAYLVLDLVSVWLLGAS